MNWTPEMDAAVKSGFSEGLSARLIGERLGVTRNAVLGRSFRLGLCNPIDQRREPERTAIPARRTRAPREVSTERKKHTTLGRLALELNTSPGQIIENINDLRDLGHTWQQIGTHYGVNAQTILKWAIEHGDYQPRTLRYFTDDEVAYLCDAWAKNVPVEEMADHLNRSFGVVRQTLLRLKKRGEIGARDPAKTRLLRVYGEAALSAGETASEVLRKISQAKKQALAAAISASQAAKRRRYDDALARMREAIASGSDRNAAIFECRAEGVGLDDIGAVFGISRERVRQICNDYAGKVAIEQLMSKQ
jgi:hypothetical protein